VKKFLIFTLLIPVLISHEASAQQLPTAQVWLASIMDGEPVDPKLISPVERYNNQPMFSPDGSSVFFTAEQEDGQTDIARYEIGSGELSLVSETPEDEYSPTPIPGQQAVSVIRVEPPNQLQRLWGISTVDGTSELLIPNVEPVGYHSWLDAQTTAVFILGDSFTLHLATIGEQPSQLLANNIGRTIRVHPGNGQILFVDKNVEPWAIAAFDANSGKQTQLMSLFPGIEDFEVDPAGRFWMGSGSKLYRSKEDNSGWELEADFQAEGMNTITRLASSPDGTMLAIVASP
jgi:hypothetical protein